MENSERNRIEQLENALKIRDELIVELMAEVREWLCEECNTVYPGPPQPGFGCVQCPQCGSLTGPRVGIELRRAKQRLEQAIKHLTKFMSKSSIAPNFIVDPWTNRN